MIPIALASKKEVAQNTLLYTFRRPEKFSFEAGQYVSIQVTKTPFSDDRGNFRAFSIASAPFQKDVLEFAMRRSDSAFKKNLESLEVGETVLITPAVGKCVLPGVQTTQTIVFLVGGVGVTPARSILFEANYAHRTEKFFLFDSNRCPEEAPFLDEFSGLRAISLVCVYTMSGEAGNTGPLWTGERGRIDSAMIQKYVGGDWGVCRFYVVGVSAFVQAMRDLLLAGGVAQENILSDDFGKGS